MKSVLISINPKWCRLIASGEKTIEVRKTKPKLKTPFKCYIYCTLQGSNELFRETLKGDVAGWNREKWADKKGKVIGEFLCSDVVSMSVSYSNPNHHIALRPYPYTGLTDKEIMDYLGNGKNGWGWIISDLTIYDNPKSLNAFHKECDGLDNTGMCDECENAVGEECDCSVNGQLHLTRPPQSWCYVEERD